MTKAKIKSDLAQQIFRVSLVSWSTRQRRSAIAQPVRKLNDRPIAVHHAEFFFRFGVRIRELRRKHGYTQEDMIFYGFATRHWQQIESGRPISVSTLLRICAVFRTSVERLVHGLDRGIYGN